MSQQAVTHDINQIGNLMADQPEKTKDSPATVQDLRNMGIAIDANFIVIRSEMATGFAKVESEFNSVRSEAKTESALLRSEMATGFAKVDARFTTIDAEFKTVRSEMKAGFSDAKESLRRWDGTSVQAWTGNYDEYLTAKVSRVFPDLFSSLG